MSRLWAQGGSAVWSLADTKGPKEREGREEEGRCVEGMSHYRSSVLMWLGWVLGWNVGLQFCFLCEVGKHDD